MPSALGIRRPPVGQADDSGDFEHPQHLYPTKTLVTMNTTSTSPADQQVTSKKSLPHLPDELWLKIWTLHASDWVNSSHFYIVDNGPWLVNVWQGCFSCRLPVGLGVSHFVRDIMLSVIRARGIQSWEDKYKAFDQWARLMEKFRKGDNFKAEALIDFWTWAKSCDMKNAPKEVERLVWVDLPQLSERPHYQQ